MDEPIVFISRNRVKQGKVEDFVQHYRNTVPTTEVEKPGTLAQVAYFDQAADEMVVIRLFPSAEAMDLQLQGADERSKRTYAYIEPVSIEVYGRPSQATLGMMQNIAGSGVPVHVFPAFVGGFLRLSPGSASGDVGR